MAGGRRRQSRKKALLPTLNEAQTETEFIQPALEILGFSLIPQVTTFSGGSFGQRRSGFLNAYYAQGREEDAVNGEF